MTDTPTAVEPAPATPAPSSKSREAEHLNMLWKLAHMTSDTEMVPRVLRGRPDAALAVMVYGHELGLQPMTALREVFIIEGTPSCSAKLMRALIYRAGHRLDFVEVSRERVVVKGERKVAPGDARSGAVATVSWEIEDAKLAGLAGKDVWKKYPRSMLCARATSELARLIFPDVTIGYTPEELTRTDLSGDYDYIDVEADVELGGSDPGDRRAVDTLTGEIIDLDDDVEARAERDEDDRAAAAADAADQAAEAEA